MLRIERITPAQASTHARRTMQEHDNTIMSVLQVEAVNDTTRLQPEQMRRHCVATRYAHRFSMGKPPSYQFPSKHEKRACVQEYPGNAVYVQMHVGSRDSAGCSAYHIPSLFGTASCHAQTTLGFMQPPAPPREVPGFPCRLAEVPLWALAKAPRCHIGSQVLPRSPQPLSIRVLLV